MSYINEYSEESLEYWEENDEMDTWEAAFVRGTRMTAEEDI